MHLFVIYITGDDASLKASLRPLFRLASFMSTSKNGSTCRQWLVVKVDALTRTLQHSSRHIETQGWSTSLINMGKGGTILEFSSSIERLPVVVQLQQHR